MQAQEELELPPWEKFLKYNKFPYKLILHFIIVGFLTTSVLIVNLTYASYSRSLWLSAVNDLYPSDYTRYQTEYTSIYQYLIYTQQQTIENSNHLIASYFNLTEESVSNIIVYDPNQTPESQSVPVPYVKVVSKSGAIRYPLINGTSSYWPLNYDYLDSINLRTFFNDLKQIEFHMYVKSYGNSDNSIYEKTLCYDWQWWIGYDLSSGGLIQVNTRSIIESRCERISTSSTIYTLAAILFALCLWYQVLLIKAVARQLIILSYLKIPQDWLDDETRSLLSLDHGTSASSKINQSATIKTNISNNPQINPLLQAGLTIPDENDDHDEDDDSSTNRKSIALRDRRTSSSESSKSFLSNLDNRKMSFASVEEDLQLLRQAFKSLTWKDKLKIINLWFVVSTFGNIFALIYSARIVFYFEDVIVSSFLKASLGLACFMCWFSLVQYLEFFPRYYILISMLKITVPRVSQFLLGVFPLFIGYVLLGMICFGDKSERFGSFAETLRTLFSVVNGDIIYDTFYDISFAGFPGQIYLYVYTLLFTYVVLMTIIAIVEEAFFEAQDHKGITNSINSPPPPPSSASVTSNMPDDQEDISYREKLFLNISSQPLVNSKPYSNSFSQFPTQTSDPVLIRRNTNDVNDGLNDSFNDSRSSSTSLSSSASNMVRLGRRDLPEHVRLLLRTVDRVPSSRGLTSMSSHSNLVGLTVQTTTVNASNGNTPSPSATPDLSHPSSSSASPQPSSPLARLNTL